MKAIKEGLQEQRGRRYRLDTRGLEETDDLGTPFKTKDPAR